MIKLENVTKVYRVGKDEIRALQGVDLAIGGGELVAITGPSGSGKTTLMGILGCLDAPTSGRYLLEGTDVSQLSERRLAKIRSRKIGFVFQVPHLVSRTSAIRNVELPMIYAGMHARRDPTQQAWERTKLGDQQKHLPPELSWDQRHQVAIARALINDPAILLAEEPTADLDSAASAEIMTFLRGLADAHRTVVVTTHRKDVVQFATRVMRMRDGRIMSDPTPPVDPVIGQQSDILNG